MKLTSNPIPSTSNGIIELAGRMVAGLTALAPELNITQVTATMLAGAQGELIYAENAFNSARSARLAAYGLYHTADDALYDWIGKVRGVLTGFFGTRWSSEWAQAGYVTPTTATPRTIEGRTGLALRLIAFFTASPTYEAPSVGVTASAGTIARDAVVQAQAEAVAADGLQKTKGDERDAARAPLTTPMRMLIRILEGLLAPNDPRWLSFGLNMPATDTTPGQPQDFTAEVMPDQTIMAQCDAVPLATRYRWRLKVVGVDADFRLALSTTAPLAVISSVDPGQTVELYVQAVNGNAQGVPSETLTLLTMRKAAAATPAAATPLAEHEAKAGGNGNGHWNGNGNGNGNGHHRPKRARVK